MRILIDPPSIDSLFLQAGATVELFSRSSRERPVLANASKGGNMPPWSVLSPPRKGTGREARFLSSFGSLSGSASLEKTTGAGTG